MTGKFIIKFVSGKVERDTELIGQMQLFVFARLQSNNKEQHSQIEWVKGYKNQEVTWNKEVEFTLDEEGIKEARLFLEVRDEDLMKDDVVGSAWLNLNNCGLLAEGVHETEVTLFFQHVHAGVLRIETRYEKAL